MEENERIKEMIEQSCPSLLNIQYAEVDGTPKVRIMSSDGSHVDYDFDQLTGVNYDTKITANDDNTYKIRVDSDCGIRAADYGIKTATASSVNYEDTVFTSDRADCITTGRLAADSCDTVAGTTTSAQAFINSNGNFVSGGYVYPSKTTDLEISGWVTNDILEKQLAPLRGCFYWMNSQKERLMKQIAKTYVEILMSGTAKNILWLGVNKDNKLSVFKQEADARKMTLDDLFERASSFAAQKSYTELFGPIVGDLTIDWYIAQIETAGKFIEAFYDIPKLMRTRRLEPKKFGIEKQEDDSKKSAESLWPADHPFWALEEDEDEDIYADEVLKVEDGNDIAPVLITQKPYQPYNTPPFNPPFNPLTTTQIGVGDCPWNEYTVTCSNSNALTGVSSGKSISDAATTCKAVADSDAVKTFVGARY